MIKPGKYTLETFSEKLGLTKNSALNKLSKLKKKGLVTKSGGGNQKRIYTLHEKPYTPPNGFYSIVNKYSPEKLVPAFEHHVYGKYNIENAIVDGLEIKGIRTRQAISHLFRHVKDWKKLFDLAKKRNLVDELYSLYEYARKNVRCKRMPKKYQREK